MEGKVRQLQRETKEGWGGDGWKELEDKKKLAGQRVRLPERKSRSEESGLLVICDEIIDTFTSSQKVLWHTPVSSGSDWIF